MIRIIFGLLCLLVTPAVAETPGFSRATIGTFFNGPDGARIQTTYANGRPKCEGTFIRRKSQIVPHGEVQIWYPSGQLYQQYMPRTATLTTWYPGGTIQRQARAPLEAGGDYIDTRYYTNGQMRERTVERFNDPKPVQRLELYYSFDAMPAGTPGSRLSLLQRSSHTQFQIKEGWHPNGQPHFIARFKPDAPLADRVAWTWYDPKGVALPETRYFFHIKTASGPPTGWIKAGLHRTYHDNGQLQSRIEYLDDREHGRVQRFADTGQMLMDAVYARGELRGGTRSIWDARGQLLRWDDGGAGMSFDSEGRLKSHAHRFRSGELTVVYAANGAITQESVRLPYAQVRHVFSPNHPESAAGPARYVGALRDNRAHGRWSAARADESPVFDVGFDERGRLSGPAKQWFPNGQIAVDCTFDAGQPHGLLRTWYADGTRAMMAMMVKGQTIGSYATWYADGTPHETEIRSATDRRILGKWDAKGQPQVLEVHEPTKGRHVTETMHGGVVTSRKYRYPGRSTLDWDQHDAQGRLETRTEHIDDDPTHTRNSRFWPTGALKSRYVFRDRHAVGVFEHWHENGQLAKRGTSDAKGIQGILSQWDAAGKALPDTQYVDGIQQIVPDATDPCFCDTAGQRPRGFMQGLNRLLALDALRAAQPDMQVEGYEKTFARSMFQVAPHGARVDVRGTILSAGPLVAVVGGTRLVLNPCRNGTNVSTLAFTKTNEGDQVEVDMMVGTVGVEFPAAVLRPLKGDALYRMTAEVGRLSRSGDGKIDVPRTQTACVPPARVGETGLVLRPSGGRLTLRPWPGKTQAQNVPALVAHGGQFEFTAADGGVFHGQIQQMRVTGRGMRVRLAGAIDGPTGGLAALAKGLKAQGLGVTAAEATLMVRIGE